MHDNRALQDELNQTILKGEILAAFDGFYADDCTMQENSDNPRVGAEACRAYQEGFVSSVAEFHGAELLSNAVDGDLAYSEWIFDITFKDGSRATTTQVSARVWKDGKVVRERFFYQPNIVPAS